MGIGNSLANRLILTLHQFPYWLFIRNWREATSTSTQMLGRLLGSHMRQTRESIRRHAGRFGMQMRNRIKLETYLPSSKLVCLSEQTYAKLSLRPSKQGPRSAHKKSYMLGKEGRQTLICTQYVVCRYR